MDSLDPLNVEAAVKERLSEHRFNHSLSVAETAVRMAEAYGTDQSEARLAGLLHDWDRGLPIAELIRKAKQYGIEIPDDPGGLLHAHTAARTVAEMYPMLSTDVIQAIDRHTVAAPGMSNLDMIIYVADMIEPTRSFGDTDHFGQLELLRGRVGRYTLEAIFISALQMTLDYLRDSHLPIDPRSFAAMADIVDRSKHFQNRTRYSQEDK